MADKAVRNGFHRFFEQWIVEQNQLLQELVSSRKDLEETSNSSTSQDEPAAASYPLVERVTKHYEDYYETKSRWSREDVLSMFHPSWLSSLEVAYSWIGGWRPTVACQLLYSLSGIYLESRLTQILGGTGSINMDHLSPVQLNRVNDLHRETLKQEKEITEKYASHQETVADKSMVELSHVATEMIEAAQAMDNRRIDEALTPKELTLLEVLKEADDLRLKTLKEVLTILTPIQRIHFLIAAAELHLRFHEWGKARDARVLVHHHHQDDHN